MLGQGGFGTVYLVYNVPRNEQCAMKIVHYSRGMSETSCRGVVNELKVLCRLAEDLRPAPYLLQPYAGDELWAWRSPGGYLHVVTELCTGGDLSCYQYRLSDETLALVCAEVIVGLHYLHELGIVHHDLKPQNVLVNAAGHCVIGDYGGAQFLDHRGRIERGPRGMAVMTIPFAAPELLSEGDTTYGPEVDYWALGTTLVSLIMDDEFLPGARDSSTLWVRLRRVENKMRQLGVSEKLHGFIMALLDESPSTRPSYHTIGELPFLFDTDWDAVQKQRCPPFRIVREIGALAHGFSIPVARVHETRAPVDLLERMRQEQLSLVVDASYDVEAHKTLITSVV
ncbi:kinase-like protein [Trametes maxima]|nr:kinase-like protein [Trametes maxima]